MTAALGLVAALAWNGAIRAIFKEIFGDPDTLSAMLVYAVTVTIVAVIAIIWIGRVAERVKKEEKKAE
jgi:putative exporter of polyketide antibiotics